MDWSLSIPLLVFLSVADSKKHNSHKALVIPQPQLVNQSIYQRGQTVEKTKDPKVWKLEINLPEILRTIKSYSGVDIGYKFGQSEAEEKKKVKKVLNEDKERSKSKRTAKRNSKVVQNQDVGANDSGQLDLEMKSREKNVRSNSEKVVNVRPVPRRNFHHVIQGYVEEGPGAIHSDPIVYPKSYQEGRLKHLLYLKKKRDKRIHG